MPQPPLRKGQWRRRCVRLYHPTPSHTPSHTHTHTHPLAHTPLHTPSRTWVVGRSRAFVSIFPRSLLCPCCASVVAPEAGAALTGSTRHFLFSSRSSAQCVSISRPSLSALPPLLAPHTAPTDPRLEHTPTHARALTPHTAHHRKWHRSDPASSRRQRWTRRPRQPPPAPPAMAPALRAPSRASRRSAHTR
jgi:hypothetical protein